MKSKWIDLFNEIAQDRKHIYLHQMSGWKDIEEEAIWEKYVADVIQNYVKVDSQIFEAGCGCGGFLVSIKKLYPGVKIAGIDAAESSIQRIKKEILPNKEDSCHFQTGNLPFDLAQEPSETYDITLANSVFQYIQNKDDAQKTVEEMIRITKRKGYTIVADVCDEEFRSINEEKMRQLWPGYGEKQGYPCHAYYKKDWWNMFQKGQNIVFIRHVTVEEYWRRKYRYVVYIQKH